MMHYGTYFDRSGACVCSRFAELGPDRHRAEGHENSRL